MRARFAALRDRVSGKFTGKRNDVKELVGFLVILLALLRWNVTIAGLVAGTVLIVSANLPKAKPEPEAEGVTE